ncbi:dehypoxanthine futalosine cyclase [bacterium]|nr:dehypoxanthine futalosine cyclase [bacterium]
MPRISPDDALALWRRADLYSLGERARKIRDEKSDPAVVTYVVDCNVNYSNVCAATCSFCAFYRRPGDPDAYSLSLPEIDRRIHALVAVGGTQLLMQGGLNPDWRLADFERLFSHIKKEFPTVDIHCLSPVEIAFLARLERLSIREVLERLKTAGLDSLPGGGAEILVDRVRKELTKGKAMTDEWLEVMRQAHRLGMPSTATMMFGHIETIEERIEHLLRIRELQDETGGFTAFIPWTYQPGNTELGGREVGAFEFLRTLALSRIFLDNFTNVQTSWLTPGEKIGQIGLFFGANDMGGTLLEEHVVHATGVSRSITEERLIRLISDAGFRPQKRNTYYKHLPAAA